MVVDLGRNWRIFPFSLRRPGPPCRDAGSCQSAASPYREVHRPGLDSPVDALEGATDVAQIG